MSLAAKRATEKDGAIADVLDRCLVPRQCQPANSGLSIEDLQDAASFLAGGGGGADIIEVADDMNTVVPERPIEPIEVKISQ
nr:hypothetical protein [Dietzia sp. SYD-A1]